MVVTREVPLFGESEHLVGRRREQQDLYVLGCEEIVSELADLTLGAASRPFEECLKR